MILSYDQHWPLADQQSLQLFCFNVCTEEIEVVVSTERGSFINGVDNVLNAILEASEILRVNGEKERQFIVVLLR